MSRFDLAKIHRRDCLKLLSTGLALPWMPRLALGAPASNQPFWINIQASGGWDQTLFCDPKPQLRPKLANKNFQIYGAQYLDKNGVMQSNPTVGGAKALEVKSTPNGGIPYLALADFHADQTSVTSYQPFFPTYYDRITVFNGIDVSTNNHSVGERYCAAGATNETFPCIGAQLAAGLGSKLPLAFMTMGGRDETGDVVSSTPMNVATMRSLLMLTNPNDVDGNNSGSDLFFDTQSLDLMHEFRDLRLIRLQAAATLSEHQAGYAAVSDARATQSVFSQLKYGTGYYDDASLVKIAFDAYRSGLAVSLNVAKGGFDSHGDAEAENAVGGTYGGNSSLYALFEFVKTLLKESESPSNGKAPIPVVMVITSDFGRSPYYTGNGSDHWPIASMMIVQNNLAKAMGFALPTNTVIGTTTDGDSSVALQPVKLDPNTLKNSDSGIVMTPGHVMRMVRRMAGIENSAALMPFPLEVDRDLNLG